MFHVKHEAWGLELEALGLSLDPRQLRALERYQELLLSHAIPRGFVAASDRDRLWPRHVADGLRGALEIPAGGSVVDLGSGAGIPGVPLAIVCPSSSVTLVEPRRGRAAFLEAVVDGLGLPNVDVFIGRAQDLATRSSVCAARAFSSPRGTWEAAEPLLNADGILIYWAGAGFDPEELGDLQISWRLSSRSDLADGGPLVIMGRQ
jgi:16S rRNA (guanine527-N7)-methyltransferase